MCFIPRRQLMFFTFFSYFSPDASSSIFSSKRSIFSFKYSYVKRYSFKVSFSNPVKSRDFNHLICAIVQYVFPSSNRLPCLNTKAGICCLIFLRQVFGRPSSGYILLQHYPRHPEHILHYKCETLNILLYLLHLFYQS